MKKFFICQYFSKIEKSLYIILITIHSGKYNDLLTLP